MTPTSFTPPLRTSFARLLLIAFAVVHGVLALGPGPTAPVITAAALVAMAAAATVLVLVPGDLLPVCWTVAAVALTAAGVAAIIPALPGDGWPGYASWPLGAATFVAIGLALRRRILAAWISEAAMMALCFLWSVLGGAGPLAGLELEERHLGVLLIGTLFAVGLRRASRDHDALAVVQRREALDLDYAEQEQRARHEAVQRVLLEAGPTLERIAAGEQFDEDDRGRIVALEGRLRDEIALAPILSERLEHALASARSRGVDVVVLTEPTIGDLPASMRLRAAEWLAARLDGALGDEFVGRVTPRGQELRVSASADRRTVDRVLADGDTGERAVRPQSSRPLRASRTASTADAASTMGITAIPTQANVVSTTPVCSGRNTRRSSEHLGARHPCWGSRSSTRDGYRGHHPRVLFNGRTPTFQVGSAGSTPATRSMTATDRRFPRRRAMVR